jgi:hypothetical protein
LEENVAIFRVEEYAKREINVKQVTSRVYGKIGFTSVAAGFGHFNTTIYS